jgi:hypothetical protein
MAFQSRHEMIAFIVACSPPPGGEETQVEEVRLIETTTAVATPKSVVIAGSSVMATRSSNIQRTRDGSMIYRRRHSLPLATDVNTDSPTTTDKTPPSSSGSVHSTRSSDRRGSRSRYSINSPAAGAVERPDRKRPATHMTDAEPIAVSTVPKRRRIIRTTADGQCLESDAYCWLCHNEGGVSDCCCELCPRLYHAKCLGIEKPTDTWVCPECEKIMKAENVETCSKALSMISVDVLCSLLKFVIQRMKYPDSEPFFRPVDCALLPNYTDYVFNPMDFSTLEKNIKRKLYGSTEAFTADVKWILHNTIIYNGSQ